MFIDATTLKRVNINAPYKGRSRLDTAEIRAEVGVIEVVEPTPPQEVQDNPDWYIRTEQEDAPYLAWTRREQSAIDAMLFAKAKVERTEAVSKIIVTVGSKQFDGDEISQGRMARAIIALDPLQTTLWILADNTPDPAVTREELREALRLAGSAQTTVWIAPYQP